MGAALGSIIAAIIAVQPMRKSAAELAIGPVARTTVHAQATANARAAAGTMLSRTERAFTRPAYAFDTPYSAGCN